MPPVEPPPVVLFEPLVLPEPLVVPEPAVLPEPLVVDVLLDAVAAGALVVDALDAA